MGNVRGQDNIFEADERRIVTDSTKERQVIPSSHGGEVDADGIETHFEVGKDLNPFNISKHLIAYPKDRAQITSQIGRTQMVADDKDVKPFPKDRR